MLVSYLLVCDTNKDEATTEFIKAYVGYIASEAGQQAAAGHDTREVKREPVRAEKTVGRNDLCPCGSGKKYKNCHGKND